MLLALSRALSLSLALSSEGSAQMGYFVREARPRGRTGTSAGTGARGLGYGSAGERVGHGSLVDGALLLLVALFLAHHVKSQAYGI